MLNGLERRIAGAVLVIGISLTIAACGDGVPENATVPEAAPSADNQMTVGRHSIHINAVSTDDVPPEVAKSYGIVRSQNRALLNVAVVDTELGRSIDAVVTANAVNLTGQLKNISLRRVEEPDADGEGKAVYFIGEVPVANRETLTFDVAVTLPDTEEPVTMKFTRQFFSD